jgi:ribosomal protein S21
MKKGIGTAVIEVVVQSSFEEAMKELKKRVNRDGIHIQNKRRLAFAKPSDKRKAKEIIAARRRWEKERRW